MSISFSGFNESGVVKHYMIFNLTILDAYICGEYFLLCSSLKNVGKGAIFPGGYGRFGEIPNGWQRLDGAYRVNIYANIQIIAS